MKKITKEFHDKGHVKIKNFLSFKEKKIIKDIIHESFKKSLNFKKKFDLEDEDFHKQLISLRKKKPKKFGEIYDNINLNSKFRSIFYTEKFLKTFAKILKVSPNQIFITGFMMRLDAPKDKRNKLDWHQDSSYYMMAYPKFNAGVCWCAVTQNDQKNGTLVFVPKTHKKFLKTKSSNKKRGITQQNKIHVNKKDLSNSLNLNQNFGDASFLHMNLKHRSGDNFSKKVRISMACRFIDMSKSFNTGVEFYRFNDRKYN